MKTKPLIDSHMTPRLKVFTDILDKAHQAYCEATHDASMAQDQNYRNKMYQQATLELGKATLMAFRALEKKGSHEKV